MATDHQHVDSIIKTVKRRGTDLGVDAHPDPASNTVDRPVVLLLVQLLELSLLLPIIDGTDHDDDKNGDQDGDTLDPFDLRGRTTGFVETSGFTEFKRFVFYTDGLVDTEDKGNQGGDTQDDLPNIK